METVCPRYSHEYTVESFNDCFISLHQWEYMEGPNLFQELGIKQRLRQGFDEWFETPLRSIKTEGSCCFGIV